MNATAASIQDAHRVAGEGCGCREVSPAEQGRPFRWAGRGIVFVGNYIWEGAVRLQDLIIIGGLAVGIAALVFISRAAHKAVLAAVAETIAEPVGVAG